MLGLGLDFWSAATLSPSARGRLVPVNANSFYLVVRSDEGAMGHRFIRNNLGDASTPAVSVGAPFQPWRYSGSVALKALSDDPMQPDAVLSLDVGATDVAAIVGGVFGASYHGGEVVASEQVLLDGVAHDPATAGAFSNASLSGSSTVDWGGGATLSRSYGVSTGPGGGLQETQSLSSGATSTTLFIGMSIASGSGYGLGHFRVAGGAPVAFPIVQGTTYLGQQTDIAISDPATGRWFRSQSNAAAKAGFRRAYIQRSASPARSKLYYEFNPGVIGNQADVGRQLSFGRSEGSAPSFASVMANGSFAAGLSGWVATNTAANASAASGQLQLVRHASVDVRINNPTSTIVGKKYLVVGRLAGGTSPVNVCSIAVGTLANGSLTGAVLTQAFTAQGYLACLFTSPQTMLYVAAVLAPGIAGQTALFSDFALYQLD